MRVGCCPMQIDLVVPSAPAEPTVDIMAAFGDAGETRGGISNLANEGHEW
jgi:hypothetical protein